MKTNRFLIALLIGLTLAVQNSGAQDFGNGGSPADLLSGKKPATLHAIVVADIDAGEIGPSVKNDLSNLEAEIRTIAKYTDLALNLQVLKGDQLNYATISATCKSLPSGSDDTVLFYFCGHGFHVKSMKSEWPGLILKNEKGIELFAVHEILRAKKPRLLLTFADCCNNFIPEGIIDVPNNDLGDAFRPPPPKLSRERYKALFQQSSGNYIASSATKGQIAWANQLGGMFTQRFLGNLRETMTIREDRQPEPPTWDRFLGSLVKWPLYRKGDEIQNAQWQKLPQ